MANILIGRGTAVHASYGSLPRCDTGAGARGGSSRTTDAPVTCKRCLRIDPDANGYLTAWHEAIAENSERNMRAMIEADHADAIAEDEARTIAEARSIAAGIKIDGCPQAVTEILDRAELVTDARENLDLIKKARELNDRLLAGGLDDYVKAEAIRDAIPAVYRAGEVLTEIGRSMTSLCPHDALRHAERARDLAAARVPQEPADNEKRVILGMLSTSCGWPGAFRAWAERHSLYHGDWTVEGLYAAHEADHADALGVNAWIDDNRDICQDARS